MVTPTTPLTPSVVDNDATPAQRRAAMTRRRHECPIARVGPEDATSAWYLADYASVAAALPAVHHFGGAAGAGDVAEDLQSFNGLPEPRHGEFRRVINGLVAAHRAREAEPFIAELAAHLVSDVAAVSADAGPDGTDVMEQFVDPLPCAVIAWLLGWPTDDPVQLYRWTVTLCDRAMEMAPGSSRSSADLCPQFAAYVDDRIDERYALARHAWPDDGLTHMLTADIHGEPLSRTAVRTQLMFLLGAGSETTRDLIGGLLHDLATDASLYRRVREDRALVPVAVEEALRLWAPTQFMVRRCLEPIAIGSHGFESDDVVMFGLASANRDETLFADPDAFDINRPNVRSHLSFGAGPHVCPGAALARAEARIAVNAFLDRFETAEIASGGFQPIPLAMFNGPRSLRLRLR
jgi:cytochrome P450